MSYRWRGGEELWVRLGAHHPQQILIIEPLFEEKNRTRRLIADLMRGLNERKIGSTLPDLPGTGESLTEIGKVSFDDWKDAIAAVNLAIAPTMTVSLRSGALLDFGARHAWRFAPETGARIVRDLKRSQLTSAATAPLYAGHALSAQFLAELEAATPPTHANLRTIRLNSDAAEADAKIAGTPLWRRAEPGDDPELAAAMVADIASWMLQCAA
jgi:hypothetical protein